MTNSNLVAHAVIGPGNVVVCIVITKTIADQIVDVFKLQGKSGYKVTRAEEYMLEYLKREEINNE